MGALNIHASDEVVSATKPTNFTLVRLRRDILRRSSVGGMCHQQFEETDIVTVRVDAPARLVTAGEAVTPVSPHGRGGAGVSREQLECRTLWSTG